MSEPVSRPPSAVPYRVATMSKAHARGGTLMLSFGPFRLFPSERRLERDGVDLSLGSRALDILIALTRRAGETVSRKEIIAFVWPDTIVGECSLRVHIAGLRKALGDGRNGARYINNVPGRGYCFVASVDRSYARDTDNNGQHEAPAVICSLPSRPARVIGREQSISEIRTALLAKRFVSIVGPGGIGKTTVAVTAAHELAVAFSAICFLDLGALGAPGLLIGTLASALGLSIHARDPLPNLLAFLQARRSLLIFDNCEHIVDAVAALTERIFAATRDVHILTTSREMLRVEGEQVFHLPPLQTPPLNAVLRPEEICAFPAIELFLDRAMASGYRGAITDHELILVAEMCSRLDGIALAIELIAGRAGVHGIEGAAGLLDHRFRLLWQGRRTALPRHQTLNALVDWSYNLLPESERQVLRLLSIFVGAFTLDAARALIVSLHIKGQAFEEVIEGLVSKSLISAEVGERQSARYRLLGTTRAHALNKLSENDETDTASRVHAEYFMDLFVSNSRVQLPFRRLEFSDAFSGFLGNVRAALHWCFDSRRAVELGSTLAATSAAHLLDLSLISECYRWTKTALTLLEGRGDPLLEMELQGAMALSAMFVVESSEEVENAFRRALQLAEEHGDNISQVRMLAGLNLFLTRIGDCREGLAIAERSKLIANQVADPDASMVSDWMLGISHSLAGNSSLARMYLDQGFAHSAALNAEMNFIGFAQRIGARVHLARTHWLHGFPDQALRLAQEALSEATENGHPVNMCICLVHATSVFLWRGDWDTAEATVEKLYAHADRHELAPFRAVSLGFRGELLVRRGKPALGNPLLRDGLTAMEAEKLRIVSPSFAVALADGLAAISRYDEALETIAKAISEAELTGEMFELPEMLRVKAQVLCAALGREATEVDDCLHCSLEHARRQAALGWELRSATTLAQRRRQEGRISEAYDILMPVYGRFVEGHGTRDLKIAKGLIGDLHRHRSTP